MPESINSLPVDFISTLGTRTFQENSFVVAQQLLGDSIRSAELQEIVEESINFPAPLVSLDERIASLELWHGPTMAFKDFGARFMATLMSHLIKGDDQELRILVATSGDTGGAVASGFFGVEGISVTILFPKGKVSPLQQLQLTTWGGNIEAIEIDGTFDDCQALVKKAFLDSEINERHRLSSANSINIARLIPQSFYYFEARRQLNSDAPLAIAVPSGNFGNLTAGLLAKRLGLRIDKFLACTNVNDIVPEYLRTGNYDPRPSIETISNAMDVGNPSNFQRMADLFSGEDTWQKMASAIDGYAYSDESTKNAIAEISQRYDYVADPHGAIGFLGLQEFLSNHPSYGGIFLETAHPAKFLPVMEKVLGKIDIPEQLARLQSLPTHYRQMNSDFLRFKSYLLES